MNSKIKTKKYAIYPNGDVYDLRGKFIRKIESQDVLEFLSSEKWVTKHQKDKLDSMIVNHEIMDQEFKDWKSSGIPLKMALERVGLTSKLTEKEITQENCWHKWCLLEKEDELYRFFCQKCLKFITTTNLG